MRVPFSASVGTAVVQTATPSTMLGGAADGAQDLGGLVVRPVVDDLHEQVGVGRWQGVDEEVAGLRVDAGGGDVGGGDHIGQVEQDAARGGRGVEHGVGQVASAAADVGDGGEGPEVVGGQHVGDVGPRLGGHAFAEDLGLVGMGVEVGEEAARLRQLDPGGAGSQGVVEG